MSIPYVLVLFDGLPATAKQPLGGQQALYADGSARVDASRGDAHLSAQAEAKSVAEARGGVDIDAGAVHASQKVLGRLLVLCRENEGDHPSPMKMRRPDHRLVGRPS